MNQKENIDFDTCIIMLDFAENYQYVLQDEIQSLTGQAYYLEKAGNEMISKLLN